MSEILIRPAGPSDAAGINAVYNPFIRESAATFETIEYSETDRLAWIEAQAKTGRHPVMVAVDGEGAVRGFANAAPFDPRGAYESSIKTSVFLAPEIRGRGVARRLYEALFQVLAGARLHRAYALIVAPNPASVALHKAFGFSHIATLNEVGRKFGRYYNVMWFEKRL